MERGEAWKVLKHRACEIIACNGLSIAPHDLKLGALYTFFFSKRINNNHKSHTATSVENYFNYRVLDERCGIWDEAESRAGRAEDQTSQQHYAASQLDDQSSTNDISRPTVYIFQEFDGVHVRASGAPQFSGLRASFDREPTWLDDGAWHEAYGLETKNGLELTYHSE
jgi:hypothetical protein